MFGCREPHISIANCKQNQPHRAESCLLDRVVIWREETAPEGLVTSAGGALVSLWLLVWIGAVHLVLLKENGSLCVKYCFPRLFATKKLLKALERQRFPKVAHMQM